MPVEISFASGAGDIPALMEEIRAKTSSLLEEIAQATAEQAKARCPYDDNKQPTKENPSATHLRDTITASEVVETSGQIAVSVTAGDLEAGVGYAPFVELGTVKMAAQPYLGPSYEEGRSNLEGRLSEIMP